MSQNSGESRNRCQQADPDPSTQPACSGILAGMATPNVPKHVYLVDGSGYIFRAFHALPPLTRADGTPVNAVLGFTTMLMKLLAETDADHIAVIFDAARDNFRNKIYTDYKAHRPEPPDELKPQFGLIREATRAFNMPSIELRGYEADDLIATYARQAVEGGAEVTIVSSDKDLMQLIRPGIRMWDPIKNKPIGAADVEEKFGVPPAKVAEVQALAGDSPDNVPGVPGIGVKTAAELIKTYGDLDALLKRAGEIKQPKRRESLQQNAELARVSRELVKLKDDVAVEAPLASFARREPDRETLLAFLKENQFRSVIARVESGSVKLGNGATAEPAKAAAPKAAVAASAEPAAAGPVDRSGYELVQSLDALDRWIAQARTAGMVAFDTETTSLDSVRADLVGISLATAPGVACYIPVGHRAPGGQGKFDLGDGGGTAKDAPPQIPLKDAVARLKPLLEDAGILKIGQNIKYDMEIMARHGVRIAPHDDTMLISYVLEGALHGHGMDELSEMHLQHTPIKFSDVAGSGKTLITFDQVPLDKARDYSAEDADVTLRLHQALKPRLTAERLVTMYETIERPLIPIVADMELAGIKVDRAQLNKLSNDFSDRLAELETQIHKLAGHEFNIGSPKQLGEVLFDEMGLPGGKKGKTGAYATGADVLEDLAGQGHDLPARVLDWRQIAKLKSTYADALVEQINPQTGRVHTSFALASTSTGRLSSNDPNLQNIPVRTEEGRKIRRAFVAEP